MIDYIDWFMKCFTVSFDEDGECFKITMKRDKSDRKKLIFNKDEFYKVSTALGIPKNSSKTLLKVITDDLLNYYNNIL